MLNGIKLEIEDWKEETEESQNRATTEVNKLPDYPCDDPPEESNAIVNLFESPVEDGERLGFLGGKTRAHQCERDEEEDGIQRCANANTIMETDISVKEMVEEDWVDDGAWQRK